MVHRHAGANNLKYKHNLGHPPMVGPVIDPSFVLFPSLFQSPIFRYAHLSLSPCSHSGFWFLFANHGNPISLAIICFRNTDLSKLAFPGDLKV